MKKMLWRGILLVIIAAIFLALPDGAMGGSVPLVLEQSGQVVERFWKQFPEVNCKETVRQAKLEKNGKMIHEQESQFDYLVLVEMSAEELGVTESRQILQQPGKTKNMPLMVSNGFSMMLLIFHPFYQDSFEYAQLTDQWVEGKRLLRIHFQHLKGTRSPSALELRGKDYPLDWEGTAWIDPDTWAVHRIEADLMDAMDDVGLQILHCDVHYGPVRFSTTAEMYWLPQVAEIEVESKHQRWHNVHRFSDYKRFSTAVREEPRKQP